MAAEFAFVQLASDSTTNARTGRIATAHGSFETPAFMPVGTRGSVKAMTQEMLEAAGAQCILGNTYHLYLRPGHLTINHLGGLHKFMSWSGPILTDSGGFQVFSLGGLRQMSEDGAEFQSHIDGSRHLLTPEMSMEIQVALGSDIMMVLDECTTFPSTEDEASKSLDLTLRWAKRSKERVQKLRQDPDESERAGIRIVNNSQAVFGINQGGVYLPLRQRSIEELQEIGFDGYSIGGLSVGEPKGAMFEVIETVAPLLPQNRPRYLMGVGTPEDIVNAVAHGVDMFDCVMPTRNARNGQLFTSRGRLNIKNTGYREDSRPIDEDCGCAVCLRYSRAYIRHLYMTGEILGSVLNTHHNIRFYLDTMSRMRQSITLGAFEEFRSSFLKDLARGQG